MSRGRGRFSQAAYPAGGGGKGGFERGVRGGLLPNGISRMTGRFEAYMRQALVNFLLVKDFKRNLAKLSCWRVKERVFEELRTPVSRHLIRVALAMQK